jgi:hypothetical protein
MIEQVKRLYAGERSGKEICRYFGKKYNKSINSLLVSAFAGGGYYMNVNMNIINK